MRLNAEETARAARSLTEGIGRLASRPVRIMEVCGTHTVAIFPQRYPPVLCRNRLNW